MLLPSPPSSAELRRLAEREGQFVIHGELGRGANGPVFLAVQPSLANRAVVLKFIPSTGREHLSLARLQHTHIVPLFAVLDHPEEQRRLLCMPYLGGASLDRILEEVKAVPVGDRTGQHLLAALDRVQCQVQNPSPQPPPRFGEKEEVPLAACGLAGAQLSLAKPQAAEGRGSATAPGPMRKSLPQRSWTEAVCWIGACLADALHYAHERGLVHLDVKLSNILLTGDAQPMLLDFHVAQQPIRPGGPFPEALGGTPGYSAPEQHAALAALALGSAIPEPVDGRSDIYSLGLALYRLLGGSIPLADPHSVAPLHRINPRVSVGLSDIVARCLAVEPARRYPTAQALAEDLRRHLAHKPLLGVRNRSLGERWSKWKRRNRYRMPLVWMALAVLTAAVSFVLVSWQETARDRAKVQAALLEGQAHLRAQRYDQARDELARGLEMCRSLPGGHPLADTLDSHYRLAQRAMEVEQFHRLAERLRFLCGGAPAKTPGKRLSPALENRWREVWHRRHELLDKQRGELEPVLEEQLRTDLLDLALIWADLRLRGLAGKAAAAEETARVLQETRTLFGDSQVLGLASRGRQPPESLKLPGADTPGAPHQEGEPPRTAWEHTALGRWLLGQGNLQGAAEALERAVELQPAGFWPHFYQGTCAQQLGRHQEAIAAFRVCIALAPGSAPCYYNRALAHEALQRPERALRDYTRALEIDPDLAEAALNRGVLHLRAGRHALARADLNQALAHGASPDQAYYNLALVSLEQNDQAAALSSARKALQANPAHPEALDLCQRLAP